MTGAELARLLEPTVESLGYELADLELRIGGKNGLVRVFIDRPEGVGLEDCEAVSRQVSALLDVEDPVPGHYVLEVSSPGLDRPLRGPDDYRRFAGRLAKVVVTEPVDNQKAFEGRLGGIEDNETVLLEARNGRLHKLPLRLIARGRLEVEF